MQIRIFWGKVAPIYSFDKADVIVSFGADFYANWMANDYATDYVKVETQNLEKCPSIISLKLICLFLVLMLIKEFR